MRGGPPSIVPGVDYIGGFQIHRIIIFDEFPESEVFQSEDAVPNIFFLESGDQIEVTSNDPHFSRLILSLRVQEFHNFVLLIRILGVIYIGDKSMHINT